MDRQEFRKRVVDLAWAAGITVMVTLLATPSGAISREAIVALVLLGGLSFSVGVIGHGWIKRPRDFQGWLATVGIFVLIWGTLFGLGRGIWPQSVEARLELYYRNSRLDRQVIELTKHIDPTNTVQPLMFIDPNNPSIFCITGISVANEGNASAEVQSAYLDFPAKVSLIDSSPWEPSNSEGTRFMENWNKEMISPHQPPVPLNAFHGTSVPPDGTQIKVRIFYGNVSEAIFTIKVPSD